jgi:hypothetical protein
MALLSESVHAAATAAEPGRPAADLRGGVTVWAAIAVAWLLVVGQAVVRWIASPSQFSPAPNVGPDHLSTGHLVALRVFEVISVGVLAGFVWFCVVQPVRRTGRLSLDGKFVIGGLVAFWADAFLNIHTYLFAWNSHNVNLGVWSRFMPFHAAGESTRYAESALWGPPMYVYFCAGVAIVACRCAAPVRLRYPALSNVSLFTLIWCGEFAFDFVVENVAIRATQGYAYAQTYGPLTLWKGSVNQFPLYESILVASLGCLFTWMRMQALADPEGLSPVERGFRRWHSALQGPVRTLAVIGFCVVSIVAIYHLTFNWLGLVGTSHAHLPSYLLAG